LRNGALKQRLSVAGRESGTADCAELCLNRADRRREPGPDARRAAGWSGMQTVFIVTAVLLTVSFLLTRFLLKETGYTPVSKKQKVTLSGREVFCSRANLNASVLPPG